MRHAAIQIPGLLMLCFIAIEFYGQGQIDTGFTEKKRVIDSLIFSIDAEKSLSQKRFFSISNLGAYHATCYYSKEFKKIAKTDCYFLLDSGALKTFYYYNDDFIKIIDNGISYYNFHELVEIHGVRIDQGKSKEFLDFSVESKNIIIGLLE